MHAADSGVLLTSLVVRRGPDGIDLGARLPLQEPVAHAVGMAEPPMGEAGQVRLRSLSETRSSRAIFGPKPQLAWTLLTKDPGRAKLLVAVAAGRTRSFAEDQDPKPVAVHIVGQAIDRPSPKTPGVHGAARKKERRREKQKRKKKKRKKEKRIQQLHTKKMGRNKGKMDRKNRQKKNGKGKKEQECINNTNRQVKK
eukprot:TRINITY_DN32194_c0_g1_i1.p3 TRINITY_DN32194_c0_g1~~TRINITY_DN32194_c0_g1_i1.p3  ORF type:complete len:197 (+),score=36.37 TRINITY_DN32194_c0_g1_i1:46-636(+)